MKILYIIDSLKAGGKEKQLVYLAEKIATQHEVILISFNEIIFYKNIINSKINVITFPSEKRYSITTFLEINKLLVKFKPDIIQTWSNNNTILFIPYILFSKCKLISSIRFAGKIKKSIAGKYIFEIVYLFSSKIISNSYKGLEVEGYNRSKKGKVIYNGIELTDFIQNRSEPTFIHDEFDPEKKYVIMVASFKAAKDYKTLIQAAKIIQRTRKDIGFLLVGNGEKLHVLKNYSKNNRLENICFLGQRKDIMHILSLPNVSIGILLTNTNGHAESLSNTIMEYMASELPVIATNAGGNPEIVKDNVNGYLIPPFNPEIVASKILLLLNNENLLLKMGKAGKQILKENFTLHKMVEKHLTIYKQIKK